MYRVNSHNDFGHDDSTINIVIVVVVVVLIIIFKPTSTKPQAGKLGYRYKIMVATAILLLFQILCQPVPRWCQLRHRQRVQSRAGLRASTNLPPSSTSETAAVTTTTTLV